MDRGAWWAIVHGVTKELDMTYQLNNNIKTKTQVYPNFQNSTKVLFFLCNHSGTTFFPSGRHRLFISHVLMFGHAYWVIQCMAMSIIINLYVSLSHL